MSPLPTAQTLIVAPSITSQQRKFQGGASLARGFDSQLRLWEVDRSVWIVGNPKVGQKRRSRRSHTGAPRVLHLLQRDLGLDNFRIACHSASAVQCPESPYGDLLRMRHLATPVSPHEQISLRRTASMPCRRALLQSLILSLRLHCMEHDWRRILEYVRYRTRRH